MTTPRPPRPPYPQGGDPGESDESLAAPLRAGSDAESSRSAALLMARHWQPATDYAVICLATSGPVAQMVTAAAFHQVLDRLRFGEPAVALRPRLLLTVRDTIVDWAAADRITAALPGLGKPAGGRGMRAAKSLTPENRALAERSFHALAPLEQALLWHTAVEAEPLGVPAVLLGLDEGSAAAALEQARERFREGCVRAHRELAPSAECRHYNRLFDVPIRRGGDLLPDVRRHLAACTYCRHAAEQLGQIDTAPGALLAEAVLGWGARRYLDSRPGRSGSAATHGTSRRPGGRRRGGGRRGAAAGGAEGTGRRRGGEGPLARVAGAWSAKVVLTGVGVASAGLLVTVYAVGAWPGGGGGTSQIASTGAEPAADPRSAQPSDGTSPSASAGTPTAVAVPTAGHPFRLRNVGADLCLSVKGEPRDGGATTLALCSGDEVQRWTYDADGMLHSAADPQLCLDSHADPGVVILGTCTDAGTDRADDVRYDLTVRGELLPRWDRTLALAAADTRPGSDIVAAFRDRSAGQLWLTDTPSAKPDSLSIAGASEPPRQGA
ncbi:ricin-type beta-trefoil lectin domain protein [Streptomyces sp. NPDC003688]